MVDVGYIIIVALSEKYELLLQDLIELCVKYMCSHIALAASHNQLISWLQYTLSLGHYLVAQVMQYNY